MYIAVLVVFFGQGWCDQGPWFAGVSCGFWFQETALLLFSVPFLFYQCLVLNVHGDQIRNACSRCGRTRHLYYGGSVLYFCTGNCGQWIQWPSLGPFCSFFLFVLCHFRFLVIMIPGSLISLLICCHQLFIWHITVSSHVVVSDAHPRTFINIEIHLSLSAHSTSLLIFSCSYVKSSMFLALGKFWYHL